MLVANLTRPVLHGVRVRVIGIRLGLQFSKTDDKHVNTNGEVHKRLSVCEAGGLFWIRLLYTTCRFLRKNWILVDEA